MARTAIQSQDAFRESVKAAALILHTIGRVSSDNALRGAGVRGDRQRVRNMIASLVEAGEIPAECRPPGRRRGNETRLANLAKQASTPDKQVADARTAMGGTGCQARPHGRFMREKPHLEERREPPIWAWLAERHWTPERRAMFRRGS